MMRLEVTSPSHSNLRALASSVPIGQRGLVHIWGRNDTPITQDMGIDWIVKDPTGRTVEEYSDWSYGHGPGDDHEFIGGRFDLDKEGIYTLNVDLLMGSPDNPVVVDSYDGNLCTTTVEIPPEYELIYHHEYPLAKTYAGKAEECTARFRIDFPDQFYPSGWVAETMVSAFAEQVEEQGGMILDVKIYEDTTPTWWTDYIMVVTAVTSPFPWVLVIGAVLAIILIVAFTNLVVEVKDIDWGEVVPKVFPILAVVLGIAAAVAVVAVVTKKKKRY